MDLNYFDENVLNDGHVFEAIDRLHITTIYLQSILAEQSLIASVKDFQDEVNKSIEILGNLYQTIGSFDTVAEISEKYSLREGFKVKK